MRIKTVTLYKYDELPTDSAKEKAREWYRQATADENFSLDEMIKSLEALFKAAGITLKNYEIGAYSYSSVKFDMGDAGELSGARALAWLENNLFSRLRITQTDYIANRRDYIQYGDGYRVGKVKPCPLTGMCYDEDLLESLRADIKSGDTLKDAFSSLADKVRRMNEDELEYQSKDENVAEMIEANEYEFDEDGNRA